MFQTCTVGAFVGTSISTIGQVQPFHCPLFMVRRWVRVSHRHFNRPVPEQFHHRHHVHTRHPQPGCEAMPQVMEAAVLDSRPLDSSPKPNRHTLQRLTCTPVMEHVLTTPSNTFQRPRQAFSRGQLTVPAILSVANSQIPLLEVNILPCQAQDFASPHPRIQSRSNDTLHVHTGDRD